MPPIAVVFARTAGPEQLLLVCRVTSFYPRPITVTWLRDGRELPPNTSTVLPNADLTYQLRSTLLVSPRDGHSYACRVQHRSLGDRSLLVPWGRLSPSGMRLPSPIPSARGAGELTGCLLSERSKRGLSAGIGAVLLLAAAAMAALLVRRYR